ncbi:hypothetical protein [Streptomyces kanamyceticus]|uniref:hypothetical protein n=1 Tax=Streptomyces kanamyceticus TaxID=1967 RepID=UPI0037DD64C4
MTDDTVRHHVNHAQVEQSRQLREAHEQQLTGANPVQLRHQSLERRLLALLGLDPRAADLADQRPDVVLAVDDEVERERIHEIADRVMSLSGCLVERRGAACCPPGS